MLGAGLSVIDGLGWLSGALPSITSHGWMKYSNVKQIYYTTLVHVLQLKLIYNNGLKCRAECILTVSSRLNSGLGMAEWLCITLNIKLQHLLQKCAVYTHGPVRSKKQIKQLTWCNGFVEQQILSYIAMLNNRIMPKALSTHTPSTCTMHYSYFSEAN